LEPATYWLILFVLGAALAVVAWTDLVLLWFPLRFGSPEWEFGTISAHFDGMPLATIGLLALTIGAMGRGWRLTTRVLAIVLLVLAVAFVAVFAIFLLDVPLALRGVAAELRPAIVKAVVKASVYALTYVALYGWLAAYLWGKTRASVAPVET
jgi:hypothetical protein